jgi:formamidopyrimidine-DNA glycosylase
MPELPEVESYKKHLDNTSLNKVIKDVRIKDDYVLKMLKEEFTKGVKGKKIEDSKRHGKWLFVKLSSENLLFHFGMSGDLMYHASTDDEPEYSKIIFEFKSGDYLSYISVRKLGEVKLIKDIDEFIEEEELGPDALEVDQDEFLEIMDNKSRSYIKSALMDQNALAGIGNEYSDEILFQAKVYPKIRVSTLSEKKLIQIFDSMKQILKVAIEARAKNESLPDSFIMSHRDKKATCPVCESKIERIEISGRHGYYCPKCQSK